MSGAAQLRLEHEGQRIVQTLRLELGGAGALVGFGVGSVARHAVVQAGAAGQEAFGLGIVLAADQAHELVHQIAVEPRRPERVLGHQPARREDGEIAFPCRVEGESAPCKIDGSG